MAMDGLDPSASSNQSSLDTQQRLPEWVYQTRQNIRRRNFYETSKYEETTNMNAESQETIRVLFAHSGESSNPQLLEAMYQKAKSDDQTQKIVELEKEAESKNKQIHDILESKQNLEQQYLDLKEKDALSREHIKALERTLSSYEQNELQLSEQRQLTKELKATLHSVLEENLKLKIEIEEQDNLASIPASYISQLDKSSSATLTAKDFAREKIGWNMRETVIKPPTDVCTTSQLYHTPANTNLSSTINTNRVTGAIANATVGKYVRHGDLFVTGGADGVLRFHNARDRKGVHSLSVCKQPITCLSVSPDTQTLCFGSNDRYAYVCPHTGIKEEVTSIVHAEPLSGCSFLSNTLLVTTTISRANCINIYWDRTDTRRVTRLTEESAPLSLSGAVRASRFSTAHYDKSIKIWQLTASDAICLNTIEDAHDQRITSVLFSHNENYLGSTGYDSVLKVRDMRDGTNSILWSLSEEAYINKNPYTSFSFSPDDKYIAAGSNDGTLVFWDLRNTTEPVSTTHTHHQIIKNFSTTTNPNAIIDLDWNQNGKQIGAVTNMGRVLFFDHEKNLRKFEISP